MSFISSDIIHDGWEGTRTFGKSIPEFVVRWIVRVDDKADGPNFILKYCGLPNPGDKYNNIGNDNYGYAICKTVRVSPLGDNAWRAAVTYAAPILGEAEEMEDEEGKPTDNPAVEGIDISISLVQMSKAALSGSYLGQYSAQRGRSRLSFPGGPPAGAGNRGPNRASFQDAITNSARVPFDPPPEIDYSRTAVTISRNQLTFDATKMLSYNDTVNQDAIVLDFKRHSAGAEVSGLTLTVQPYQAKMQTIGCQLRRSAFRFGHASSYYRVSFEFHIDTVFGWSPEILDRGYSHSAIWDPVKKQNRGQGEVYRSSADPAKTPAAPPIQTAAGHTATEPQLLNGAGIPLGFSESPVFLKYQVYEERPWGPLALNDIGWDF